jgi:hypothetical protein
LWWPRGKVLGGSSSINAMCYIRGVPRDYDDWAAQGADGWDWESVLPWFKRSEGNSRGGDALHGSDGPLSVSDLRHVNPLSQAFVEAGVQAGLARNPDFNGPVQAGVGLYQVTPYLPTSLASPAGMWMKGCQSRGPASSSSTLRRGSAERRLASTQPAEPAPMMMVSNTSLPADRIARHYAARLEQLLGRALASARAAAVTCGDPKRNPRCPSRQELAPSACMAGNGARSRGRSRISSACCPRTT